MKLRNKKTGEIWEIPKMRYPTAQEDDISFFAMLGTKGELFCYRSIAELNDDFEDYKPAEPLIKDEKISKAVRAWAEACELDTAQYDEYWRSFRCDDCVIGFKTEDVVLNLDGGEWYTIAELCGEKEE